MINQLIIYIPSLVEYQCFDLCVFVPESSCGHHTWPQTSWREASTSRWLDELVERGSTLRERASSSFKRRTGTWWACSPLLVELLSVCGVMFWCNYNWDLDVVKIAISHYRWHCENDLYAFFLSYSCFSLAGSIPRECPNGKLLQQPDARRWKGPPEPHSVPHWTERKSPSYQSNWSTFPCHAFFSLFKASFKASSEFRVLYVADHHLTGAGEGVPERDAAVCAAGATVCAEESLGRGAAVCGPSKGQRFHHSHHGLARANYAGHQAGKSYL